MLDENVIPLSDELVLNMVSNTEDNTTERKTRSDKNGWLVTAVAFANSLAVGQAGVLFVGINNDGSIQRQEEKIDWEDFQKTVSSVINKAWPPIYPDVRIREKDGMKFVSATVYGSANRPHFAGRAYIRIGPETREASEPQFDELIAQRNSTVRALLKNKGNMVTWRNIMGGYESARVINCNQFYVTLKKETGEVCFPLDTFVLSHDPEKKNPVLHFL